MTDRTMNRVQPPFGAIIALVAVLTLSVAGRAWMPMHWDTGWLLYAAREMNAGAVLYRDLLEINPPLIVWLYRPLVFLADALGVGVRLLHEAGVLAVVVTSAWLGWRAAPEAKRWPTIMLFAATVLLLPGFSYGQREHLLVVLALPYTIVAIQRLDRQQVAWPHALSAGVLMGLAYSLKPHFLLGGLAVLALQWRRLGISRSLLTLEHLTVATMGTAYLIAVVLLAPEYFPWARLVGPLYYEWLRMPAVSLFTNPATLLTVLALTAWQFVRQHAHNRIAGDVLAAISLGWLGGALLQGKGWTYHFIPVYSSLVGLAFISWRAGLSGRRIGPLILLPVILLILPEHSFTPADTKSLHTRLRTALDTYAPLRRSALALTHRLRDPWPMVLEEGLEWTSPYPSSWWMTALYPDVPASGNPLGNRKWPPRHVERTLFHWQREALLRNPPDVIVVKYPSYRDYRGLHQGVDPAPYLSADPHLAALLSSYCRFFSTDWIVFVRPELRRSVRFSDPNSSTPHARRALEGAPQAQTGACGSTRSTDQAATELRYRGFGPEPP